MRLIVVFSAIIASAFGPPMAFGDEDCVSCGSDRFPETATVLENLGYGAAHYEILFEWQELTPRPPLETVKGIRLHALPDGEPFDLYVNTQGELIHPETLAALGIFAKHWDLKPTTAPTVLAPTVASAAVARPLPLTPGQVPLARVELPPVDQAQIAQEDAATQKSVSRIGVFQEIVPAIEVRGGELTDGTWVELAGGETIWSAAIYSPEAVAQRVHFAELDLPAGAEVILYNQDNPEEVYGPYTQPESPDGGLWTATCFNDTVVVECRVPAGVPAAEAVLRIDRTVHVYKSFDSLPYTKAAGLCNLDVTCYPSWSTTATAVGGIGTIGDDGYMWCTGTLLNDLDDETYKPFFLTAYHCVPSGADPSTIEIYWLYQSSQCNGAPPDPSTVPRTTGGANLMAGIDIDNGTDFALLRLNNTPPAEIAFAGWTSDVQAVGTEVTVIHHPWGDYKRISFGALQFLDQSEEPQYRWDEHKVIWSQGTTEPGSSGSPLLTNDTQLIMGQLRGGTASCSAPDAPDYFGRFDITYPLIQPFLDPNHHEDPPAPPPPTNVEASDGTKSGAILVSWHYSVSATEYQVWRSETSESTSAIRVSGWIGQTSYLDKAVVSPASWPFGCGEPTEAPVYYYFVKARNEWGESALSSPDTGTAGASDTAAKHAGADLATLSAAALALLLSGYAARRRVLSR